MTNTTISIPDYELAEMKLFCQKTGRSISGLLRQGAKLVIERENEKNGA